MPISHENIGTSKKNMEDFLVTEPLYSFGDVILSTKMRDTIESALAIEQYKELIYDKWGLGEVIKQRKSISLNLYGIPGTGKTMVAHAIARELGLKILVVDYASIESKYVGETSKNLVKMFDFAKNNEALLLFDEADALLSKRVTMMNNATDVSVNQTRNVLLKLLDLYDRPIIFTTNFIQNYDPAFYRRISHHIKFDYPNIELRRQLWKHYLVDRLPIEEDREELIEKVSEFEPITGAEISNVILNLVVDCARGKIEKISSADIEDALNKLNKFRESVDEFHVETKKISKDEAENILQRGNM